MRARRVRGVFNDVYLVMVFVVRISISAEVEQLVRC